MSVWGRSVPLKAVAALVTLLVLAVLLPAMSETPSREVVLVVKQMAFYLEGGDGTPNPTIVVRAGERVRILLRNDDRGMTHDFAVPTLNAAIEAIDWNESEALVFEAPSQRGSYEYVCRPHMLMMRGTLRVE
jgi:plastocyanin